LAAARKKKEGEKAPSPSPASGDNTQPSTSDSKGSSLSLRERLAIKQAKQSDTSPSLRESGKGPASGQALSPKKKSPERGPQTVPTVTGPEDLTKNEQTDQKQEPQTANIRSSPSTFASTIIGDNSRPKMTEPSHLYTNTLDLIKIYGQDLAEPFDFAGPSPDDVVLNAQSSAKGLAIRRKI
jgi:elongation factor 1 alpha-like protein